eukprot:SAG11_NODE_4204_length_2015_cov_1.736952_1_plen_155_part_10
MSNTDWIDVGHLIDVFNHGQWGFVPGNYSVEVGVREANRAGKAAGVQSIANFSTGPGGHAFEMLFDASTRATKRMRHQTEDMYELAAQLDAQTPSLVPTRGLPTHVPVFGGFFDKVPTVVQITAPMDNVCRTEKGCAEETYGKRWTKLNGMFGIT